MKAFIIKHNGKRICTAGVGANGVLSAIVNWVAGGPHNSKEGDLWLSIGGLDSTTQQHLKWKAPKLRVGDSVTVKVVEAAEVDPESQRYSMPKIKRRRRQTNARRKKN